MFDDIPDRARSHVISDGVGEVAYAGVGALFSSLDELLARQDVGQDDCVAVAGKNGVLTAVALLYLLARERRCLPWQGPVPIEGGRFREQDLPAFCDWALLPVEPRVHRNPGGVPAADLYRLARRDTSRPRPDRPSAAWVYVCTSGTTGVPKVAVYRPEKLLGNARNCVTRLRLAADDRVLVPLPIAHMYGLGVAFLPAVHVGASVHLLSNANLMTFLEAEERFDPNVTVLATSFCHLLVSGRKTSRPYRLTGLGGDRMDENTFAQYEQRHGCAVNIYGATELGAISAGDPLDPFPVRRDTVGRPMPGVRLRRTEEGILCFAHPYACEGYADEFGEPCMPADLVVDGWYQTRDLGRVDGDGYLSVSGRADLSVKRDGFLVAFSEVERVLGRIVGIERAVVLAGDPTPRGKALIACCVSRSPQAPEERDLRRACLEVLPAYAVPDRFVFLEAIPLTAAGKPDRRALESFLASRRDTTPA
jgi:acyl-CoA synthetase (AMP-forming)/AMP-acid ligase II